MVVFAPPLSAESRELPAGGAGSGRNLWGQAVLGPVRRKPLRPANGSRLVASVQVGASSDGSDPLHHHGPGVGAAFDEIRSRGQVVETEQPGR
jgi:hypothetical protein